MPVRTNRVVIEDYHLECDNQTCKKISLARNNWKDLFDMGRRDGWHIQEYIHAMGRSVICPECTLGDKSLEYKGQYFRLDGGINYCEKKPQFITAFKYYVKLTSETETIYHVRSAFFDGYFTFKSCLELWNRLGNISPVWKYEYSEKPFQM